MGKKKKKTVKPWCYYCDREFDDEKILIQHQKAKHFKCHVCHKKLSTASGMVIHCLQVHKENVTKVPNAKTGRESTELEIFGMEGIPWQALEAHDGGGEDEPPAKPAKQVKIDVPSFMPPTIPGMPLASLGMTSGMMPHQQYGHTGRPPYPMPPGMAPLPYPPPPRPPTLPIPGMNPPPMSGPPPSTSGPPNMPPMPPPSWPPPPNSQHQSWPPRPGGPMPPGPMPPMGGMSMSQGGYPPQMQQRPQPPGPPLFPLQPPPQSQGGASQAPPRPLFPIPAPPGAPPVAQPPQPLFPIGTSGSTGASSAGPTPPPPGPPPGAPGPPPPPPPPPYSAPPPGSHMYAAGPRTDGPTIGPPPIISNQPPVKPAGTGTEVYLVWSDENMSMEERRALLPKYMPQIA